MLAAVPALSADGGAYAGILPAAHAEVSPDACPETNASDCTFHVTDSMYMPEVLGSMISEDYTTGRLYVATVPHYSFQGNDSTIRIYDADRNSVPQTVVLEDTKIVAMGINHATRELHVVAATDLEGHPAALSTEHYTNPNPTLPPIASASLVSYSMDDADGSLDMVDSVSLARTYKDGNSTISVPKIDVRDIAVDHLNDRVYVAGIWGDADPSHDPDDDWKGYAPVMVVDTAGTDHAVHDLQFDPTENSGWNPFRHSVAASAIEIDAASNTAYVVARQHDGTGHNQGVYKLNFSSNAAGDFTQNYTLAGGVDIRIDDADETIIRFKPAAVQAIDMAMYDQNLFVTFGNGTMYRFALDGNGIPEGQPVRMAEGRWNDDWSMYFAEGTRALAVDENRGLLYALSSIWHTPELRVFDAAQDGVPLISASGIGAEVSRSALEVSSRAGGTVYLTRDWVPHVMVVEPQAPTDLQKMLDDAVEHETVVIPDGTYRDTILTVDKPLTVIKSDDATFIGNSRLEIIADNVTVRDLSFEGMCLPGYPYGAVSILNGRTAAGAAAPAIDDIGEPRENVTISGISVSDTCNAGVQLVGKDGLAGSAVSGNTFTNIGLKTARDHSGPADIVAVDEYGAMHGAIGLSFHPTGQAAVTDTEITNNTIRGSSAAGIRVMHPDGVNITDNTISGTADSAVGLAGVSKNTMIADNTMVNSNNQPDFDYLDGITGSGNAAHYYKSWDDPGPRDDTVWRVLTPQPYNGTPTADAAIKVWATAGTAGISIRDNRIAGGNGGFVACAGVCGVETDGFIQHGSRDIVDNATDVSSKFTVSGNTISASVNGAPLANYASGNITVTGGAVLAAGSSTDGIQLDGVTTVGVTGVATNSSATAAAPHGIGDTVEITVTFNKPVTVMDAPVLRFAGGGVATFVSDSANMITFAHTVREGAPGQADLKTAAIVGGTIVSPSGGVSLTLPLDADPIHIDSVRPHMASAPEIAGSNLTLRLDAPPSTVDVSKIAVAGVHLAADADSAVDGSTVTITLPPAAVAAAAASERQPAVLMAAGALEDAAGNENSAHSLRAGACGVAESDTCTFYVTDSMHMPEVRAGLIREDYETGRLYVGTVPSYSFQESQSTIRVYGEDRSLLNTTVIAGERIVAMELNHETRELHVVAISNPEGHPSMNHPEGSPYLHFNKPTTGLPPIADARLVSYGMAADGALTLVDSVPLNHAYAKGADHGVVEVPKLDVRDIAVDYVNDLVYVASVWGFADTGNMTNQKANDWKGFSPIMVVDTSGTAHSLREVKFDPDSGWNPFDHAVGASAIDLDAASNTAYVVARQHDGDGTVSHGVYALDFSDGPGGFTLNYTSKGGIDIWTGPDESAILPYPAMRQAIDMARYGDGLFVTFGNGTMYRFALNEVTGIPEGTPDLIVGVSTPNPGSAPDSGSGQEWWMLWNAGTNALAVDDDRGLLYALNNVWHVPELLVFDASDPGLSLLAASNVGAETFRADLEASARPGGAVYLSRDWVPHIMVVEPQARSGLQGMIDDAPEYSTVTIPDGTYRDTVLTVGKPLTIKSDDATFIGNSRLEIIYDDVAVDGLSFEGMCLPGYPAGAVSILNGRTAAGAALPFTEGSIGAAQRQNVTISRISVSDTCNAGVQLVGKDGLAGSAVSDSTFTGIGLKNPPGRDAPADIVAVDEYAAMHGAIGLSFHPTGQTWVTGTAITNNTIDGSSAAGIRVMWPDGVNITDNSISDTADSAIGLAAGAKNTLIADNAIVNSNNQPDFDYLDGITGSGLLSHYYQHAGDDLVNMVINATAYDGKPTPDAAIKVWAADKYSNPASNITVRDNSIAGGSGGFVACAGVCGVETDGLIQDGSRDIVDNTTDVSSKFTVSGNTIREDVGGAPFANDASGTITVTGGTVFAAGNNRGIFAMDGVTTLGVTGVVTTPAATAENPHKIGDIITIAVTFNKNVNVTGGPVLRFADGSATAPAATDASTMSIAFTYTVLEGAIDQANLVPAAIDDGSIVSASNYTIAASLALPPVDPIPIDSVRPHMASAPEINGGNLTLNLDAPAGVADISKIVVAGVPLSSDNAYSQGNTVTITLPADAAEAAAASERQPAVRLMPGALADAAGNENLGHDLRVGACDVDSKSCTFHVTDSMYMPEVLGSMISEDTATGRLYVATVPHYSFQENQSTIRIYDADRTLLDTLTLDDARVAAMDINHATRELHVVTTTNPEAHRSYLGLSSNAPPDGHFSDRIREQVPPIAEAALASYAIGQDGRLTSAGAPVSLAYEYAGGTAGNVAFAKLDVRDIAVDHVNDRVYVAGTWGDAAGPIDLGNDWKGFAPILVVDTGDSHSMLPIDFDPADGWNPFSHSVGASAIEIDAHANTAYVVSRQHDSGGGFNHGVYALNFSSNAAGEFTQNYTYLGGTHVWSHPDSTAILGNLTAVQAIDVAKYGQKLFVTFGNGSLYRLALDDDGIPTAPVLMGYAGNPWDGGDLGSSNLHWNGGHNAIEVDENRGLLYALADVWHATELRVFNASNDVVPLLSSSNIGGETRDGNMEVSGRTGGTVYLSRDFVPHVMVVEPQAITDLQKMIDDASEYATVAIPDGTYRDTVLTVSEPLSIKSAGATFAGNSRLEIIADNVAVSGLAFEGMCLPGYPAGAVSIVNARTAAGQDPVGIDDGTFGAKRVNVTISEISVSDTCNAGVQLVGRDGLADSAVADSVFSGIGLKIPRDHSEPADIVAVEEYSAMHGAIGLAFHWTQQPVTGTDITNNDISGSSAAGIRVMKPDGVTISGNTIRDTADSAIGLVHISKNTSITNNTMVNANNQPNFDYMDHINGSDDPAYYHKQQLYTDPGGDHDYIGWRANYAPYDGLPALDAAIKVWARAATADVNITYNRIAGGSGGIAVCAGVCAVETDGAIHSGNRNIVDNSTDISSALNVTGNTIFGTVGGAPFANDASGTITVMGGSVLANGSNRGGIALEGVSMVAVNAVAVSPAATAEEPHGIGDTIMITVTFNGDVNVEGDPVLRFDDGGVAPFVSAGADSITFTYTVLEGAPGQADLATATIAGGSIVSASNPSSAASRAIPPDVVPIPIDSVRPHMASAPEINGGSLTLNLDAPAAVADVTKIAVAGVQLAAGTVADMQGSTVTITLPADAAAAAAASERQPAVRLMQGALADAADNENHAHSLRVGACDVDSKSCTFHVTDSMHMPEVLGRFISEDYATGRLYVATVPHYSFQDSVSTVRVYDTDRSHIQTVTLANANITAMDINHVSRELHLVAATDQEPHHSQLDPRTPLIATSSLISYDIAADGSLADAKSVPLEHAYGDDTDAAIEVPKLDVRDIATDHVNDRVYVAGVWGEAGSDPADAWKGFAPVMVVNTAGDDHAMYPISFNGTEGWNPFNHSVGATAIELDIPSSIAYVAARQHNGQGLADYGVYALSFSGSDGGFTQEYAVLGGYDTYPGHSADTAIPDIQSFAQAYDIAKYGDAVFVSFLNGSLARIALDGDGIPAGSALIGHEGHGDPRNLFSGGVPIAVDENRGLLYALSDVWHVPELRVLDASDPGLPVLSASSIGAENSKSDLEVSSRLGGTVYLSRNWVPHVMVVEPQAPTNLQGMLDVAASGGTVAIPDGAYRDTILTIAKPLTVESAGATFTGNSRLEIIADDVTVSGLSFEGMCLPGYPYGAVSILNGRTAAGPVPGNDGIGNAQRQNVTISGISVSDTCNAGVQLVGKDGLAGSAVSGNTFAGIGLKNPPGRDAPADIVAVDEYSAMHGAIGLSFHPTAQEAVTGTTITDNTISGSSAAGIRVMKPDGVTISGNTIRDTADSAIGLAGTAKNATISGNVAVNANNQPDFDYLDHIQGSGDAAHYHQAVPTNKWRAQYVPYAGGLPAPDAAIKVWAKADAGNITIRDNRIAGGSGGLVVCAGLCAVETDGAIHSGARDIVDASNDVTAAFAIRDNTMYEDVGGVHVNYLATGNLNASGNTLPPSANLNGTDPVNASTSKAGVVGIVLADEEPPASGYRIGEMVGINITFNVPVTVIPDPGDLLGLPYLEFSNGETATFAAGYNTMFLTFTHTVAPGMIPDYATAMLVLNGSKIVDSANHAQQAGTQLPPAGSPGLAELSNVEFNTAVLSVRADPAISAAAGTLSLYFSSTIDVAAMDLTLISVDGMSISGAVPPPHDTDSPVIKLPASVAESLPQNATTAQVAILTAAVADRDSGITLPEDYDGTARIIREYAVHASCDEPADDCLYAISGIVPLQQNGPAAALARANPNDGLLYVAGAGSLAIYDAANATNVVPVDLASYGSPAIHDIQINEATNTAYVAVSHGPAGSRAAALLQVDPVAPHAVTDSTPVNYTAAATATANATTITSVTPSRLAIDPHGDRAYLAVSAPSGGPVLSYDIASGAPNAPTRAAGAYPAQARDATALAASANATDGIMYAAAADGLHVLAFSEATANYTVQQTLPAAGAALDMEAAPGSLYVLHANGTLASYSVEHDSSADATALELRSIMDGQLSGWDSGERHAQQIELDAANSRLYAASHASVSVYNATGAGEEGRLSVVSLREGAQPLDLAISPDGSTALVVPSDAAHLLQIRPMPKSAIHTAIDAAPSGGAVLLPAGTYDDIGAVILDRPMALNGSGAVTLRGDSHVRAYAAGGALSIAGIAFSGTACSQGNPEGSAVAIFSAGAASISGSTFENTCGDAVAVSAPAGLDSLAATGNTFTDIGIPADGSAPERRAAAVSVGGSHDSEGQLAAGTISSNYVFGTSYAGVQLAGASAVDVSGNYVEDTPGPAVLVYQTASDVTIRGNTIVRADSEPDMDYLAGVSGSGSASFYESGPPPEAAIAVWAGADGIRATLNRVYESGPGGAFLVCEGACHAGTDGSAASTAGGPHTITTAISFNHNVLHGANSNIANLAGGMLSARNNFFPGHADQAATYVNDREKVDYVPAFDGPGPVKIGLLTLPLDAPHTRDSEIAAATAYSVDAYNSRQVAVGGLVSLELVQRAIPLGTPLQQNATFMLIHEGIDDAAHEPILRHAIDSSTEYHEDNGLRASLDRINAMDSDVPHYPFAFGLDAIVRANGANASLSGTYDIRQLTGGQAGFDAIVADLNRDGEAWWQYTFTNPLTGGEQLKRSLLVLHDGIIYGAGYYAGDGPSYYVGPTSSSTAAAILPYADANDLVLVSPVSTAISLAVRDDSLFRLVPTDAHAGDVISEVLYAAVGAGTVQGNTAGVLIPVAVDDPYGRSLVDHVKSTVTGLQGTPDILDTITYEQGQDWGGVLDDLAARIAQVNPTIADDRVAVFHVGFAADHVAIMEAANGHARRADLASAVWYADSLGNHPGVISSSGARAFAEDADLTATSFHVPTNPINAMVVAAVRGALGDADLEPAANSYSAHDAVSMLGRAVTVHADMPPAVAAGLRDIASVAPGALGSSVLDRNGDLILPTTFAVWTVDGGAWERVGDLKYGPTFCGMSLEKPGLDLGNISPGRASGTDVQTVSNSGTKTLDRGIFLSATPWTLEAESPSDNRQLPYSLTEIDPDPRGEFTALSNSPRTVIFEGMEPAKSYDVRFRINLSTVDTLPSGMLMQTVTYGIACD